MKLNDDTWIDHLRARAERERKAESDFRKFIDICNNTPFEPIGDSPTRRASWTCTKRGIWESPISST